VEGKVTSEKEIHEGIMAFIDILGISRFLTNNTPTSTTDTQRIYRLNKQIKFFNDYLGHHRNFAQDVKADIILNEGGSWNAITYSDNVSIFISGKNAQNPIEQLEKLFGNLLSQLAHFQFDIAWDLEDSGFENFLMKGGLTYGFGYIGDNIVTGPAHLEAYNLEQNNPYPNIVIDKKIFNVLKEGAFKKFLIDDCSGITFIDYLEATSVTDSRLEKFSNFIKKNLNNPNGDVLKKYQWTARYYNYHCKKEKKDKLLISDYDNCDKCFFKDTTV
jgi:hypothetical protein